jgi:hypothetical protein
MDSLVVSMIENNKQLKKIERACIDPYYYDSVLKLLNRIFDKNCKSILMIRNITTIKLSEKILRKYNKIMIKYNKNELFNFDYDDYESVFGDVSLATHIVVKIVNNMIGPLNFKIVKTSNNKLYINECSE